MTIARRKASEADKKQKDLEQVSGSLASHLQAFRCKEAEWQASEEDMQGQIKKINEDNERLTSKVNCLRSENEKLRSNRTSKPNSYTLSRNYMSAQSPTDGNTTERAGNSAAKTKLATFRTRRDDLNSSQYVSQMSDRSHMTM